MLLKGKARQKSSRAAFNTTLELLKNTMIKAVAEGGYTNLTGKRIERLSKEEIEKIIRKYWLVPLGGTDYHGYFSSHPHPLGTCTTPGEALDALLKVREELNK
jgi:hypothetical protein